MGCLLLQLITIKKIFMLNILAGYSIVYGYPVVRIEAAVQSSYFC